MGRRGKADSYDDPVIKIVDFGVSGNAGRFAFGTASSTSYNLGIYDNSNWVSFGVKVLDDLKVHHLTLTVDGTAAVLYDNGNQVATATISAGHNIDATNDAAIAAFYAGSANFFEGTIYRARVYNHTLDADDVRTAFERSDVDFSSQYGSQTELVTNGDFASATGWSQNNVTIAGDGNAVWAVSGGDQWVRRADWNITKGKKYRITVVSSAHTTNGSFQVFTYGATATIATTDLNGDAFTISGTGTHIFEFEALADSSSGVLFGRYPTGAAYVGTMTDLSCVQIGCVSDYQTQWANPSQSLTVQDASGNADGTCSASGVSQVQPVVQLNSTSARIGTSAATPADGELLVSGNLGVGCDPDAKVEVNGDAIWLGNASSDASGRILFNENTSSNGTQGFSLLYAGSPNPTLDGTTFTAAANSFHIFRHNSSAAGEVAMSIARTSGAVSIGSGTPAVTTLLPSLLVTDTSVGGSVTIRGQSPILSFDITSSGTGTILLDGGGLNVKDGNLDGHGSTHLAIDSSGQITIPNTSDPTLKLHNTTGSTNDTAAVVFGVSSGTADGPRVESKRQSDGTIDLNLFTAGATSQTNASAAMVIDGGSNLATFSGGITVSGGFTNFGSFVNQDISGGAITATSSTHKVDTQGGAGTDDLDTINGGTDGSLLILMANNSARTVVVKDGTNLRLAGDFSLDDVEDTITLIKQGSTWKEVSRSNNA